MTPARARKILELDDDAGWPAIRESYLDLVRVWHPDRFEADARLRAKAEARLAAINEAYRTLDRRRGEPAAPPVVERRRPVVQTPVVRPRRSHALAIAIVLAAAAIVIAVLAMRPGSAEPLPRTAYRPGAEALESPTLTGSPDATAAASTPTTMTPTTIAPATTLPVPADESRPATSFIARETDAVLNRTR